MAAQRGDVLFYAAGPALADRLIVAGTLSRIVHVELALDADFSVGAVASGVRVGDQLDVAPFAAVAPPWPDPDAPRRAVKAAIGHVGEGYGTLGVAALGVARVLWPGNVGRIVAELDGFQEALRLHTHWCSRLVVECLAAAGVSVPVPAAEAAPSDLARWLGVEEPR